MSKKYLNRLEQRNIGLVLENTQLNQKLDENLKTDTSFQFSNFQDSFEAKDSSKRKSIDRVSISGLQSSFLDQKISVSKINF